MNYKAKYTNRPVTASDFIPMINQRIDEGAKAFDLTFSLHDSYDKRNVGEHSTKVRIQHIWAQYDIFNRIFNSLLLKNFTRKLSHLPLCIAFIDFPSSRNNQFAVNDSELLPHIHSTYFVKEKCLTKYVELASTNFSDVVKRHKLFRQIDVHGKANPIPEHEIHDWFSYSGKFLSGKTATSFDRDINLFQLYPISKNELLTRDRKTRCSLNI